MKAAMPLFCCLYKRVSATRILCENVEVKPGVIRLVVKKRKRKKKTGKIKYEILAISLIAAGIVIFLGLYKESTGVLGYIIKNYLFGVFGLAGYGIPLFLVFAGIFCLARYDTIAVDARTVSLLLLFLSVTTLLHMSSGELVRYREEEGFLRNLLENARIASAYGQEHVGGGILGALISVIMIKLLGILVSKIFLIALIIISLTIVSDRSLIAIVFGIFKNIVKTIINAGRIIWDFVMVPVVNDDETGGTEKKKEDPKRDVLDEKIKILDYTRQYSGAEQAAAAEETVQLNLSRPNTVREFSDYRLPSTSLLSSYEGKPGGSRKDLISSAKKLEETLKTFGVEAKVIQVSVGPAITRYEIQPSPGVKVSRILRLSDDIALNMAATSVRIEAPIPGKSAVGLEIPNKEIIPVSLKEILESSIFQNHSSNIAVALGKDIAGNPVIADLSRMPHLMIAGATGSGKSVCINCLICSLLFKASPAHVKLIMIDPKMVELNHYNDIPHLLAPVVTDPRKATNILYWAVQEMHNRYKEFSQIGVKDIFRYNQVKQLENNDEYMPQIVVIIDELSDLMMVSPAEVEDNICRLAQMARAAGIHLVIATQRPSVDVITGVIKANIPSRISFAVSSQVDSRTILDMSGAEKLLGRGDMLYYPVGMSKPVRIQGAMVEEEEVEKVVSFIKKQVKAEYSEEVLEAAQPEESVMEDRDELLPRAVEIVVERQQASASLLQRKLKVGYARAARIIDQLEERGIIGGHEGSKPRRVLISREELDDLNRDGS